MPVLLSLSSVWMALSCGGKTKSEPAGTNGPLELDDLALEMAIAVCASYSCLITWPQEDRERCVKENTVLNEARVTWPLRQGEDEGNLRYNPILASQCLEQYKQEGCNALGRFGPLSCEGVVERLSSDLSCVRHVECGSQPNMFCDKSSSCPGQCAAVRADGEACVNSASCAVGSRCQDGLCQAWLPAGVVCDLSDDELWRLSSQCFPGLLCWPSEDGVSRCTAPSQLQKSQLGEACLGDSLQLCEEGLHCKWGAGEQGRCVKSAQEGDICGFSYPFMCGENRCVSSTPDSEQMRCTEPRMDGDACESSGECSNLSTCTNGVCVFPRAAGAACWDDNNCLSWACVDGKCAELGLCPE